jgi:hypothetical protein
MKKTWESPKLIVLVRARPEESILSLCKGQLGPTNSPTDAYYYCTSADMYCPYCSAEGDS